jgi:glycosyltransferase involved in cell wall biosynthesis
MATISGVVIALNEAQQLHYALSTLLPWCDEVIVVDQHSEDDTAAIAERMGATVYQHDRTGGIADPARRFAVSRASGDWVFILDADEMVPPTLAAQLRELADSEPAIDVVMVPRANVILGRWIRHGNNWPSRHARFFRPGSLLMTDRIHRSIEPAPGTRRHKLAADPSLAIWHFPGGNLSDLVRKVDRYTDIEARQAYARGRRVDHPIQLFPEAIRFFWRQYLRGRGYRDGTMGLAVAITRTYYRVLTAAKLWELPRSKARAAQVALLRDRLLARWEADDRR